jgi:hypothetical protein
MRPRVRGLGCLGCLTTGGMLFFALPLLVIGFLVYLLVNRQRPTGGPPVYTPTTPYPPQPPAPTAGQFCSQCGKALEPGARFCAGCGAQQG